MRHFFLVILFVAVTIFAGFPVTDTLTDHIGIKFKRIPAGTFQMGFEGRPLYEGLAFQSLGKLMSYGQLNEYPRHSVTISEDFYMGIYEVTNAQFRAYRPTHGSNIQGYTTGDNIPASYITWFDADSFCQWLTANNPQGWHYRLPTEAEWEYSCRAGTVTFFNFGDTANISRLNCSTGSKIRLRDVGSYQPNAWGLYDMHGNVAEWCLDWFGSYRADASVNPGGYAIGEFKVLRGKSAFTTMHYFWARSALRMGDAANQLQKHIGFRVVISRTSASALAYLSEDTTLRPEGLRNVSQSRPAPHTSVTGATYVDGNGISFKRTMLTNDRYPAQMDTVVYVSEQPITGDSAASRALAGAYAKRLSLQYGVLYRISNRYELIGAGIKTGGDKYYLTILPHIRFDADSRHPDVSTFVKLATKKFPSIAENWGNLYNNWNWHSWISESPNGDIVATVTSGLSEDHDEKNVAGFRLRNGSNEFDSTFCHTEWPSVGPESAMLWHDGKGRMFRYVYNYSFMQNHILNYSDDNGLTWTPYTYSAYIPHKHITRLNGDTLIAPYERHYNKGNPAVISTDGGLTWNVQVSSGEPHGIHPSMVVLDNGDLLLTTRSSGGGGFVKNSDSVTTALLARSADRGINWSMNPSPFYTVGMAQYGVMLKLHSGRLLMATFNTLNTNTSISRGVVLIESEDQGITWYCRRSLAAEVFPDGSRLTNYMDMTQGSDGTIYLVADGNRGGSGSHPVAVFNEQWLREGENLPVSVWGINTAGMVGTPAIDDTMHSTREITTASQMSNIDASVEAILSASPNPFNPGTSIRYSLPDNKGMKLTIYTLSGQPVLSEVLSAKKGVFYWNGKNSSGKMVSSAIYIVKMECASGYGKSIRLFMTK